MARLLSDNKTPLFLAQDFIYTHIAVSMHSI